MAAPDIEHKIRQHDNDIAAIYTMITNVLNTQVRHTNRFNELGEDVATLAGKVDSLNIKVDTLDTRMTSLEGTVNSLDGKVDQILDLLKR
ncbi:hypothetical protein [Ornithinimicrobium faecis]|uniref:hypothetical protein n=1 Tax=Ornithinimicrobium faecis TaxID=2934158 RepID=UPI0021174D69|nr:hypothetical protein [Ornithinimicrobium sp. HY1745]